MNKQITIIGLLAIILVFTIPSVDATLTNPRTTVASENVCDFGDISNNSTPNSLAVSGGKAYAVWASGNPDDCFDHELKFSTATGAGAWSTPIVIGGDLTNQFEGHAIRADGNIVDVVFVEQYSGADSEIKHTRSINGGVSFGSETVVVDLDGGGTGNNIWYFDVDGNTISILYRDNNDAVNPTVNIVTSTNGGSTFGSPTVISDGLGGAGNPDNSINSLGTFIDVEGSSILAGFASRDDVSLFGEIWMTNSTDAGVTFADIVQITSHGAVGGQDMVPTIYRDGTDIMLIHAWVDIEQNLSTDTGVTWGSETTIFDDGIDCEQAGASGFAQDLTDTDTLYMACQGLAFNDVMYSRTTDFGTTWSSVVSIADDALDGSRCCAVETYADDVWITWEKVDKTPTDFGYTYSVVVRSDDDGATFGSEEIFLDTNGSMNDPHLVTDGTNLYFLQTGDPESSNNANSLFAWYENIPSPASPLTPTFSGDATQVSFSANGDVVNPYYYSTDEAVYWVWNENLATELYFSYSTTGETHTPILIRETIGDSKLRETFLSKDRFKGGGANVFAFEDDVFVTYGLDDEGTGFSSIALKISNDGGDTFGSEIEIDPNIHINQHSWDGDPDALMKRSSDGDLYAFISDSDLGNDWNGVTYRSDDNGLTWDNQGEWTFGSEDAGGGAILRDPFWNKDGIIVDGDTIHVATLIDFDENSSNDMIMYYSQSTDEGETWSPAFSLQDSSIAGSDESAEPVLIIEGNDVLALWVEYDSGNLNFNWSDNGGIDWCTEDAMCGEVTWYSEGLCSYENTHFDQDWDYSHLEGSDTVVAMCGGRGGESAYMTLSDDMGVTWTSTTLIDDTLDASNLGSNFFTSDEAKDNMAFSWYVPNEDGTFQINSVRATLPDEISDFSSVVSHYDEIFPIWDGNDESYVQDSFQSPAVHVAGQGLWVSWIGTLTSAQSQDLFFTFVDFPNAVGGTPIITLIGASTINLNVGDSYVEQNATCLDDLDGSITVSISGDFVDTETAGIYTVLYDCIDTDLNEASQKSRIVNVELNAGVELTLVDIICDGDTSLQHSEFVQFLEICGIQGADPPVITITGDTIEEVVLGESFSDVGSTAFDNGDGDLTSSIVVVGDGSVDTDTVGAYLITYNVDDSNGNSAIEKVRTVLVVSAGSGGGSGGSGGGSPTGSPVSSCVGLACDEDIGTGVEGFTDDQQLAFEEALANAIASIPLTDDNPLEELIQTFFEFQVIDDTHEDMTLQSFLDDERLGLRWSTGDDIVLVEAIVAENPFMITFEQFPVVKDGSGAFVSTNALFYNLEVPRNQCEDTVSLSCVQKIRYEIPVTVQAVIDGVQVQDTGTITVDLTEEDIDIILLLVVLVGAIPVGAVLINRLRGKPLPLTTSRRISG